MSGCHLPARLGGCGGYVEYRCRACGGCRACGVVQSLWRIGMLKNYPKGWRIWKCWVLQCKCLIYGLWFGLAFIGGMRGHLYQLSWTFMGSSTLGCYNTSFHSRPTLMLSSCKVKTWFTDNDIIVVVWRAPASRRDNYGWLATLLPWPQLHWTGLEAP